MSGIQTKHQDVSSKMYQYMNVMFCNMQRHMKSEIIIESTKIMLD